MRFKAIKDLDVQRIFFASEFIRTYSSIRLLLFVNEIQIYIY